MKFPYLLAIEGNAMHLILFLSVACATLFILLGLYLLMSRRGRVLANRFLGAFFLMLAIDFMEGALMMQGFFITRPHWALWTESFPFLYGPLVYGYTLVSIDDRKRLEKKDWFHPIPFVAATVMMLFAYHLRPETYKIAVLEQIVAFEQSTATFMGFLLVYLHFFIYLFVAYKKVKKRAEEIKDLYSQPVLQWLKKLLLVLTVLLVLSMVTSLLQFYGAVFPFFLTSMMVLMATGLLAGGIIFQSLERQLPLFPTEEVRKYSGSELSENEARDIRTRIVQALERDEVFLDPELSLNQLSEAVGVGKRRVSQVINEYMGMNFFDLINSYRVARAKTIFQERNDPKLTVLEVMYEVGFNSKSSFNTQFKGRTGFTPSQFLKMAHHG